MPTLQTVVGEAQTNNMDGFFAKQQKHMFDNDVRPLLLLTVFAIKNSGDENDAVLLKLSNAA